jgi:hypothetical protein
MHSEESVTPNGIHTNQAGLNNEKNHSNNNITGKSNLIKGITDNNNSVGLLPELWEFVLSFIPGNKFSSHWVELKTVCKFWNDKLRVKIQDCFHIISQREAYSTRLVGRVGCLWDLSFAKISGIFGKPGDWQHEASHETTVGWAIQFHDDDKNTIALIHDWKTSKYYDKEYGVEPEEMTEWDVAGRIDLYNQDSLNRYRPHCLIHNMLYGKCKEHKIKYGTIGYKEYYDEFTDTYFPAI